ncbi:MAG: hypothetical protein BGO12_18425 [Verrucomicrobia bacterium 61-8]|nr:hypothetical protein [Verrucomicrobiota bacterium]OJV13721.1 MAG: hypothetical protein BGO12_18425 [Verrucomicrobia bacterium 61-8]
MSKELLLNELRRSREDLSRDTAVLRRELDFEAKVKQSVRKHSFAWIGSAAALGWMIAGPKKKTRVVTKLVGSKGEPVKEEARKAAGRAGALGLALTVAKFAFPYLRPVLTQYAGRYAGRFAGELAQRFAK